MAMSGTCPHCGAPLEVGAAFCAACGGITAGAPEPTTPGFSATPTMPPPMGAPTAPSPVAPPALPPGVPPPPMAAPAGKKRSPALIIGGIVGAVALVGAVVVMTSDDDPATTSATTTVLSVTTVPGATTTTLVAGPADPSALGPGEVFLEPVGGPTQDPFTDTMSVQPETVPTVSLPDIPLPSTSTTVVAGGPAVTAQVTGNNPGLYGGTRDAAACDQEAMIAFLEANPDKAAAWAGVQGIQVSEIRTFIEGLTPVVLTRDTRVTNHGFRNGQAYAHPSVLQRGHAVLVDRWGVPRAKCSCGNPLAPPQPLPQAPIYVGDPWPDFDPTVIIIVVAGDPVDDEGFVLVDLTSGELIIRTVGATPDTPDLATGDIRITLRWNDSADLDLSVTDPTGETVDYNARSVSSGGALDVDANGNCGSVAASPAENIIWADVPPEGRYFVVVNNFDSCGAGDAHSFTLTVLVGGQEVPLYEVAADGTLMGQVSGTGMVTTDVPALLYAFDVGTAGPGTDPGTDPGGEFTDEATAALTILDQLMLDCGVSGDFTDGGAADGGWRWIVSTPDGDASFVVYNPLGSDWYVLPEDELAGSLAVGCGFYSE